MSTRMSKGKWIFLYAFSGGMDLIQFIVIEVILVWFFGVGAVLNEILDPIVGVIIGLYLQFIGGVSLLKRPKRLISMFAMEGLSAVTGGIAQLWVLDVWYIHNDVKSEEAEAAAAAEQEALLAAGGEGQYYKDGVGRPRGTPGSSSGPANTGGANGKGYRAPGGSVVHR